jgi:hypothetical protein
MKDCDLGKNARSGRGQINENLPSIRRPLNPANKPKGLEFVDQAHGRMMFYLQPFAEVSYAKARVAGERLERQKRLVLLSRKLRLFGQSPPAEAEKLSHRVAEGSESVVIIGMQLRIHGGELAEGDFPV